MKREEAASYLLDRFPQMTRELMESMVDDWVTRKHGSWDNCDGLDTQTVDGLASGLEQGLIQLGYKKTPLGWEAPAKP